MCASRVTQPGAEKKLEAALQAKVAAGKLTPDTEATVKLEAGRPAFVAGEKGRALAEKAQAIHKELDRDLAPTPMTGGGTNAGFAGRSGKAAVVESFGLAGFGYHARDKYIEVDSIVPRIYLVTRLLTGIGKNRGARAERPEWRSASLRLPSLALAEPRRRPW
jgi:glutamate carboxypeptidase